MVKILKEQPGVVSILQVGSISNPGISDIDILVIFEDDVEYNANPLDALKSRDRYMFIHGLFGLPRKHFHEAQQYSVFHNCNLLWGEDHAWNTSDFADREIEILNQQIAFEFLIKMFITMSIQHTYKVIKLRGLTLHTKALLYDLEFLNINSGQLFDLIQTMLGWRNDWFTNTPSEGELQLWIKNFYVALRDFLHSILQKLKVYMPPEANFRLARNIVMVPSPQLDYSHTGVVLPGFLTIVGNRIININNRCNRFEFQIPFTTTNISNTLMERYRIIKKMKVYNSRYLKYFLPVAYALSVFESSPQWII